MYIILNTIKCNYFLFYNTISGLQSTIQFVHFLTCTKWNLIPIRKIRVYF